MRLRTRVVIFMAAVLITLMGFNLLASPSAIDMLKIGKDAGYEIISNYLAHGASQPAITG